MSSSVAGTESTTGPAPEAEAAGPEPARPHLLFVCTGNLIRSPIAAALFTQELERRGRVAAVESAGIRTVGMPAASKAVAVMSRRGIDLSGHRSKVLTPQLIRDAFLIVGMARAHVREVIVRAPEAFERSFTLKDLVRRGRAMGGPSPKEPFERWLERLNNDRIRPSLLGANSDDDIEDPFGRRFRRAYVRTADEVTEYVEGLCDILFGGFDQPGEEQAEPGSAIAEDRSEPSGDPKARS